MNSELFWQTQPFHIITGAPYCEGILGSGMSTISISTHYYLHIVIYPTLRIYNLNFWHTWNMQHVTCTSHYKWGILGSTIFDTEAFIHFIHWYVQISRYLHQYKHNISRYLQSINKVSGVGHTARDCRGPAPRHHRSRSWGPLVTGHTFTYNCHRSQTSRYQAWSVGDQAMLSMWC